MAHTKRIAVGYGKKPKFITTVSPGPHPKKRSLSLMYVLRDLLGYARTAREVKSILNNGHILVDKRVRKNPNYGVGLMDIIEIPKIKKQFIVLPEKDKLVLKEIKKSESNIKLCRIMDKTILKNNITQLNLHDGSNIIIDKNDKNDYQTKDTVVLELPKRKIKDLIKFKKGNIALVMHGRHAGKTGRIDEILPGSKKHKSLTRIGELQTLTNYIFVIGEKKPLIKT